MNIVDPILYQIRYHPTAPAICAPGPGIGLVSYARLGEFIHNTARKILNLDLRPGNVVAIYVEDQIFHAVVVLALTHLGIISVSGRPQKFPSEMHVDAVITDAPRPFLADHRLIVAESSWLTGDGVPLAGDQLHACADSDVCRIVLTSGTTGEPKAVAITHKMLFDRIGRHHGIFGPRLAPCSRIFSDLSYSTSLGYQFLIYTLWRGGTFFATGDNFDESFHAFEQYKVQCWVASPAGLANLLEYYKEYAPYQSRLNLIICGGDVLSKNLSDRVRSELCTNLVSAYGSTEVSVTATAPAQAIAHIPGAVGYVCPGIEVETVDELDATLPRGTEGTIRIRSEFGVEDYLANPMESRDVFRNGWFYPGDAGAVTPDNVLVVTGRQKSILSVGGDKVRPEAIEEAMTQVPGVHQAAVFTVPNELGIAVVSALIVSRSKVEEDQIRAHVGEHFPIAFVPKDIVVVDEIPHNAMGKIDRLRVAEIARKLNWL